MFEILVEQSGAVLQRMVLHETLVIGRDGSCGLHLDDRALSRRHAQLELRGPALWLRDLESQNGAYVNGLRVVREVQLAHDDVVELGRFRIRIKQVVNAALDDVTSDEAPSEPAQPPRVEITDSALLQSSLGHVRVGRHFVFVDDASAVMPPSGRMRRLLGYKQKQGRAVRALTDQPVELAGARIHPPPLAIERIAGLSCDRDWYRAEHDVVHLIAALPGGGQATVALRMNGALLCERAVDVSRGVAVASLAMLLPGAYEAQLVVDGAAAGAPVRFAVAAYALAPLSLRVCEPRAGDPDALVLAVECWGAPCDRALRAHLVDGERDVATLAVTEERPGRFVVRVPSPREAQASHLRVSVIGDDTVSAQVALPPSSSSSSSSARRDRPALLAGELGKELFVSLATRPSALAVRGLHVSSGDFVATPIVLDEAVGDRLALRANDAVESLVVAAYDPARAAWTVFDLGDVARGACVHVDVPRPMGIAFLGCFVSGEPFEAFTSMFAPELPISLAVPDVVAPGQDIPVALHTGRPHKTPVLLCVRDDGAARMASATPAEALASSVQRAIARAAHGLGEEFRFQKLDELALRVSPVEPAAPTSTSPSSSPVGAPARTAGFGVEVAERGKPAKLHSFFEQGAITIGRVSSNDIVLAMQNISKRHARIVVRDRKFIVVDLKSTNGTWVNGARLTTPRVLRDGDKLRIGTFTLALVLPADETIYLGARPRLLQAPAIDDVPGAEPHEDPSSGVFEKVDAAIGIGIGTPRGDDSDDSDDSDLFDDVASLEEPATRDLKASAARQQPVTEAATRSIFPSVLYCAVVEVSDGEVVRVPSGDGVGVLRVDAFFVDGGDYGGTQARVIIDKAVRAELEVAPEIDPDDSARGVLRASSRSGRVRVSLSKNGRPAPLRTVDGRMVAASDLLPGGTELWFDAGPGTFVASAHDPASDAVDVVEARVGAPGVARVLVRDVRVLEKGKGQALDSGIVSLRVLSSIDPPLRALALSLSATPSLGCEQTSARIAAACTLITIGVDCARAEEVILTGIARLRAMHRANRGFALYPAHAAASDALSPRVVRNLWSLDALADGVRSPALADAVREGLAMADDVAAHTGQARIPSKTSSMEDAWALAVREPRRQREALELVARSIVVDEHGARLRTPTGNRVADRATLAYAAAALFASGKAQSALRIAGAVLVDLDESGALYSTLDSTAALALLLQWQKAGALGAAELVVNGRPMSANEAAALTERVETVEVKAGMALLDVVRAKELRWADASTSPFPVHAAFSDGSGRPLTRFAAGDRCDLVVRLPKGYREGDMVHVCLPPAMAWLHGDARNSSKRFSVDFAGRDEVAIPVVVVAPVSARQRFAVAVRNMFEEERASSPGLLVIDAPGAR